MDKAKKRQVPPTIRKILDVDVALTTQFVNWVDSQFPIASLRKYCKVLEISCHGIPWFAFWICFYWIFNNPNLIEMQMNMLIGLFIDIIFVALIKAYTRRRRPVANKDDMMGQIGPDVFSFPSGHASRAVMTGLFFHSLYPVGCFLSTIILAWSFSVCVSRIIMRRHHILDVFAGVVLGLFEVLVMSLLWLNDDTSKWIMSYLSDEKLDGGEYHV